MIVILTIWLVALGIALLALKLAKGPTPWDRLIALNLLNSKIVMLIVLYGAWHRDFFYVDVALVFSVIGFLAVSLLAQFIRTEKGEK